MSDLLSTTYMQYMYFIVNTILHTLYPLTFQILFEHMEDLLKTHEKQKGTLEFREAKRKISSQSGRIFTQSSNFKKTNSFRNGLPSLEPETNTRFCQLQNISMAFSKKDTEKNPKNSH